MTMILDSVRSSLRGRRHAAWSDEAEPLVSHSISKLAGHIVCARDRFTPIEHARLRAGTLTVTARYDGLYELALDALPLSVELEILAPGYHPFKERMSWASVATGGLMLRDFYLIPLDMPLPISRTEPADALHTRSAPSAASAPARSALLLELPLNDQDDLPEDEDSLELDALWELTSESEGVSDIDPEALEDLWEVGGNTEEWEQGWLDDIFEDEGDISLDPTQGDFELS